jgi:hypothetical protein
MVKDIRFSKLPERGWWLSSEVSGNVRRPVIFIGLKDYSPEEEEAFAPHSVAHESLHAAVIRVTPGKRPKKLYPSIALDKLIPPYDMHMVELTGLPAYELMEENIRERKRLRQRLGR